MPENQVRSNKRITVQVRSISGYDRVFPEDDTALSFARKWNTKTFSYRQLREIKLLGYAIHVSAGHMPFDI